MVHEFQHGVFTLAPNYIIRKLQGFIRLKSDVRAPHHHIYARISCPLGIPIGLIAVDVILLMPTRSDDSIRDQSSSPRPSAMMRTSWPRSRRSVPRSGSPRRTCLMKLYTWNPGGAGSIRVMRILDLYFLVLRSHDSIDPIRVLRQWLRSKFVVDNGKTDPEDCGVRFRANLHLTTVLGCIAQQIIDNLPHHVRISDQSCPSEGVGMDPTCIQGATLLHDVHFFLHNVSHIPVSYTHLRAHETKANLVCRLLLEK